MACTVITTTSAPETAAAASLVAATSEANPVLPAVVSELAVISMPPRARGRPPALENRQFVAGHVDALESVGAGDREVCFSRAALRQT